MKTFLTAALLLLTLAASLHAEAKILCTLKPIHSLVCMVTGDTATPELLIQGRQTPHGFQLKPSHMRSLYAADAVFYVDDALETFMQKIAHEKKNSYIALARIDTIKQLPYRNFKDDDNHTEHEHPGHHKAHACTACQSTGQDLHVWLNPQNAIAMLKAIEATLSKITPELQSTYQKNTLEAIERIQHLDTEVKKELNALSDRAFIVFHDAYQYFENQYGLSAIDAIALNPELPPSANRVKELRKRIAQQKAVAVFSEPQFNTHMIQTILEGMPLRIGELDPLGAEIPPGKDLYPQLIKNMSATFKKTLTP